MSNKIQVLKLGTHRKNRRVWLDNPTLLKSVGFIVGARYDTEYCHIDRCIILRLDEEGARKVAKKSEVLPVIDLNSTKVGWALGNVEQIEVDYFHDMIRITPVEEKERSINELANTYKRLANKA
jgi:hypothetical protein